MVCISGAFWVCVTGTGALRVCVLYWSRRGPMFSGMRAFHRSAAICPLLRVHCYLDFHSFLLRPSSPGYSPFGASDLGHIHAVLGSPATQACGGNAIGNGRVRPWPCIWSHVRCAFDILPSAGGLNCASCHGVASRSERRLIGSRGQTCVGATHRCDCRIRDERWDAMRCAVVCCSRCLLCVPSTFRLGVSSRTVSWPIQPGSSLP